MSQPPPRNEEIATAGGEVAGPPRPGQAGVGRNRRGAANPGADDCRRSKRKEKGSAIVIVAILFGLASVLLLACSGLGVYFIFRWHSGKGTDAMADGRADPNTHLTTVREDGKAHAVGKITLDRKGDEQPTEVGKEEPKAGAEREAPPAKEKLQQRSPGREKRQGESRRPYLVAQLGHGLYVESLAFSPDGKQILTGSRDKTARLWDTVTGELIRRFTGMGAVASVAFSPDGKQVLTGSSDKTARLWDAATGKEIRRFTGHTEWVNSVAFSPDGKHVLTGSSGRRDKTARLWDAATGKEIRRFTGHVKQVDSVAFSPDGKHVLTDSSDKTVRLWNVATGKEIRRFTGSGLSYDLVAFSPDGKQFLTTGRFEGVHLWDAATGKETVLLGRIAIFRNSSSLSWGLNSVAFSPDGKQVLTCGGDETVHLWDVATGKEIRQFVGHTDEVTSVAFSLDGKYVLSGSWDMTTRVWDAAAGKELVQLLSFQDGSWAVVDTDGRFDTSNGGGIEGLHWVVGNEPIALSQLKARYYEPGLLAKKLGFNKEPLRRVDAFVDPKLFPEVRLTEPARDRPRLGITLTNRGGGIGRVVVLINGRELTSDARGPKPDANAAKLQLEVNLANDPRLVPGQENVIEVHAYNAEGYLRSCGMRRTFTLRGKTDSPPPELWLVVAGVSDYRGDTLDLQYAAKDADDFAQAVRIAGERLFGAEKIHLRLLTTTQEGAERQPSRANLMAALKAAQKAKPGDVLVVYLAGHGINYGGQDGDFYYLCCDAADANLADSEIRKQVALSSNELTELLKLNPAQKQVLVLDTCASGKLIEKLTEKRDVPSSQIRALELVKDRTGMYILAGCASDAVSYEATRFAQGVLTYSLLLGMRGAALKEDRVEVGRLFEFAADKVPELARDIGGIQKPVIASPKGGQPFPIGRLTAEDQARIPLQAVRPLVLRCSLQDEVKVRDHLGLSKRVNERLREASASGRSAKLVFVEAEEFPEAYGLTGRYRLVGETVTVTLTLFHGADEVARFKVEGSKTDLNALAGQIVREAEQRLESEQRTPKK
jgi:WD40 repeat protein